MQNKLLYTTTSLEEFVAIKNKLQNKSIKFSEQTKKNNKTGLFLFQLFSSSTATAGMNGEHDINYCIFVDEQDYQKAQKVIKS